MLQGTFETLSLSDVLGLLAASAKSGTLWLEAGTLDARISLTDGQCCASESGELHGPLTSGAELFTRTVDMCFAVARQDTGAFHFADDEEPPWRCDETVAVDSVLAELARLLEEWREIQSVVPSLEACPQLSPELVAESITVDGETWRLLVGLDGYRSVREIVLGTGRSVLEVCHALADLVAQGAVTISHTDPTVPATAAPTVVSPERPYGPGVDEPVPAAVIAPAPSAPVEPPPAAAPTRPAPPAPPPVMAPSGGDRADELEEDLDEDVLEGIEPRDRGALLRLFSALRDG